MQLGIKDMDLRRWARDINAHSPNKINFKASRSWLSKFKTNRNIVSRKVTKFIGKGNFADMDKIKAAAEKFVQDTRKFIQVEIYKDTIIITLCINYPSFILKLLISGMESIASQKFEKRI